MKSKVGLIHGVFDILHYGHIKYFEEAKNKVDKLIVSVTADRFVNKGPGKPIFALDRRIEVLNSIKFIDKVIKSDHETAVSNIRKIKPDFYIKGRDYKNLKDDISKNILLEKKEVEKYGGKILFTNSEIFSSSKIANEEFDYINKEVKKTLNYINKKKLYEKFCKILKKRNNQKILIIGEPILDIIRFVKPSGKSNKNNIIATEFKKEEICLGGTLLPIKFLKLFFSNLTYLCIANKKDQKIIKKYNGSDVKQININAKNKLIKKIRYVDEYTLNRLYQNNINEDNKLSKEEISALNKFINNGTKKFENIIFFNYGYIFDNKNFYKNIAKLNKKLTINIQSNSYNFGFNLANKISRTKTLSMDEAEFRLLVQNKNENLEKLITENIKIFKKNNNTIVTQGKKGAYFINKQKVTFIPSIFKMALDSTGSGDIFLTTYFTFKVMKIFSDIECLILSHLMAGLHAKQLGNRFNFNTIQISKILNSILK